MSGIDLPDGRSIRKGAADAVIRARPAAERHSFPPRVQEQVDAVAGQGATPLLVCEGNRIAGLVVLEDILKPGMRDRFERLRRMGLRTVMVTGDNPLTAKAIAEQAGVDDFIAQATPEAKLAYIRKEQAGGKLVAMMGDGTNDAPALAQADVGVAMNSGTQAAKEAGNMVDLDSDPTKLIEVVEIGKQLLMTRGALTTFSIANDLAKYFAIVPALFAATLPWLKAFDIMHLHSATSAILSAVIFNAIIIPLLIPDRAQGSDLSAGRRRRLVAAQPADLGPGRRDRSVCRHQGHRPGDCRCSTSWHEMSTLIRASISQASLQGDNRNHARASPRKPLALGAVDSPLLRYLSGCSCLCGQALFPSQADGSLIVDTAGKAIGSR